MSLVQSLADIDLSGKPGKYISRYLRHRLSSLSLSRHVSVETSQVGGIKWLDLDPVEQRYLLTAAADSTVEAFDVLSAAAGSGHEQQCLQPLFTVKRGHQAAHRFQVTSIAWYPVDSGMFVTGSADQEVKIWDTNMLEVACAFNCPDKVLTLGMSSCAASHALIAVGTRKPGVMLADMVSGAFTHTLTGHTGGTWSICWSPVKEHQLFTGDASGEVRLWDVRRSGCQALLGMHATQKPKPKRTATPNSNACKTSRAGVKRKASGAMTDTAMQQQELEAEVSGQSRTAGAPATRQLAHEGPVTGIHATADGLNLLTAGCDGRMRLWDAHYLHHQLVHYSDTFNRGAYPKRLSSTPDGRVLFYPRGDDIQVFDVVTGQQIALLSPGHYDTVTACIYSPNTGHLWSAGTDGAVLAWEPWTEPDPEPQQDLVADSSRQLDPDWWLAVASGRRRQVQPGPQVPSSASGRGNQGGVAADVDAWSDDFDETCCEPHPT